MWDKLGNSRVNKAVESLGKQNDWHAAPERNTLNKWLNFYQPFFPTPLAAQTFVDKLEALDDPNEARHRAKIMMHQVQRLISLADDINLIRPEKESLQLLFLMICAENVSKLFHNHNGAGNSKKFVREFFEQFVVSGDLSTLERSFFAHDQQPLNLHSVVDVLYSVRCDVVHEGEYWGFHFSDGETPMLNVDPDVTVSISLSDLREIIVRACLRAIQSYARP